MIDTSLVGQTAAKCMEYMDETDRLDGGEVVSVLLIVIVQNQEKSQTFTRTFCSDEIHYRQLGIIQAGMDCVREGQRPLDAIGEDEEEGDDED